MARYKPMQDINKYIDIIPVITELRILGYSFNEIADVLQIKMNMSLDPKRISYVLHKHNKGELKLDYTQLVYFTFDGYIDEIIDIVATSSEGISCAPAHYLDKIKSLKHLNIKLINESNINKIADPIGRIYAKWLTRNFSLRNSDLLRDISLLDEQKSIIESTPDQIDSIFNKMQHEVNTKCVNNIFSLTFSGK